MNRRLVEEDGNVARNLWSLGPGEGDVCVRVCSCFVWWQSRWENKSDVRSAVLEFGCPNDVGGFFARVLSLVTGGAFAHTRQMDWYGRPLLGLNAFAVLGA